MSQGDGCSDHSHPGLFRRLAIQGLAWVITRVLARGYRVAVIAPCVDRLYQEMLVKHAMEQAAKGGAKLFGSGAGQYL